MIVQPANSLLVLAVLIVPPSQAAKQCQLDMSTKIFTAIQTRNSRRKRFSLALENPPERAAVNADISTPHSM